MSSKPIDELLIEINGDNSGLKRSLEESGNAVTAGVSRIVSSISLMAVAWKGVDLAMQGIQYEKQAQSAEKAFEVFLGSAEDAKKMVEELRTVAKETPLEFAGVRDAAVLLSNFNVTADQLVPTIEMLSDISKGNQQAFQSLALAYGQANSAGRLMGQDLLQMINAGFNPLNIIAQKTGESMSDLKKRMEAGKVSMTEVTEAFKSATSEGGKFFEMSAKQMDTLAGAESNLKDKTDAYLGSVVQVFSGPLKDGMKALTTALDLIPPQFTAIAGAAGIVAAAVAGIGTAAGIAASAFAPFAAIAAGLAAAAASVAVIASQIDQANKNAFSESSRLFGAIAKDSQLTASETAKFFDNAKKVEDSFVMTKTASASVLTTMENVASMTGLTMEQTANIVLNSEKTSEAAKEVAQSYLDQNGLLRIGFETLDQIAKKEMEIAEGKRIGAVNQQAIFAKEAEARIKSFQLAKKNADDEKKLREDLSKRIQAINDAVWLSEEEKLKKKIDLRDDYLKTLETEFDKTGELSAFEIKSMGEIRTFNNENKAQLTEINDKKEKGLDFSKLTSGFEQEITLDLKSKIGPLGTTLDLRKDNTDQVNAENEAEKATIETIQSKADKIEMYKNAALAALNSISQLGQTVAKYFSTELPGQIDEAFDNIGKGVKAAMDIAKAATTRNLTDIVAAVGSTVDFISDSIDKVANFFGIETQRQKDAKAKAAQEAQDLRDKEKSSIEEHYADLLRSDEERLKLEYDAELKKAEEVGADTSKITLYYQGKIKEAKDQASQEELDRIEAERQKRDEAAAEVLQALAKELEKRQEIADKIAAFNEKYYAATRTELENLEIQRDREVAQAEEIGADVYAVRLFWSNKIAEYNDKVAADEARKAESLAKEQAEYEEKRLAAIETRRLAKLATAEAAAKKEAERIAALEDQARIEQEAAERTLWNMRRVSTLIEAGFMVESGGYSGDFISQKFSAMYDAMGSEIAKLDKLAAGFGQNFESELIKGIEYGMSTDDIVRAMIQTLKTDTIKQAVSGLFTDISRMTLDLSENGFTRNELTFLADQLKSVTETASQTASAITDAFSEVDYRLAHTDMLASESIEQYERRSQAQIEGAQNYQNALDRIANEQAQAEIDRLKLVEEENAKFLERANNLGGSVESAIVSGLKEGKSRADFRTGILDMMRNLAIETAVATSGLTDQFKAIGTMIANAMTDGLSEAELASIDLNIGRVYASGLESISQVNALFDKAASSGIRDTSPGSTGVVNNWYVSDNPVTIAGAVNTVNQSLAYSGVI